jgi:hypothetical protein
MLSIQGENARLLAFQNKIVPNLSIKKNKYVVLFNIDFSGSMRGSSWDQVCSAVEKFQASLGEDDLISCILFNDSTIDVPHKPMSESEIGENSVFKRENSEEEDDNDDDNNDDENNDNENDDDENNDDENNDDDDNDHDNNASDIHSDNQKVNENQTNKPGMFFN